MSKLVLRYRFDDSDDFGWLDVEVASHKFSGRGGFWVQSEDVRGFGEKLSTYPLSPEEPVTAAWGFETLEGADLRISIQIAPANSTGDLRVRVEVADYLDSSERVQTAFLTNYPDLEQFRVAISALMNRDVEEAVLTGL